MLLQALYDLGYPSAADELVRCSGYALESPAVSSLKAAIADGRWKDAEALVRGAALQPSPASQTPTSSTTTTTTTSPTDPADQMQLDASEGRDTRDGRDGSPPPLLLTHAANQLEMLFLIRRQRYLELLEKRNLHGALLVLQRKLTPLSPGSDELHRLSMLLVCAPEVLRRKLALRGPVADARHTLLAQLLAHVAPSAMIPEHRLAALFDYVKQNQVYHCFYHTATQPLSLLTDHVCDLARFPTHLAHVFDDHGDEVWFADFSHDGTKLVTTGRNAAVNVYSVPAFELLHVLKGHDDSVVFATWSHDDSLLLTCSKDKRAILWDVQTAALLLTVTNDKEPVTSAAFTPDNRSFVLSSLDSIGQLVHWSTAGERLHVFNEEHRMRDCALSPDGRWLVAVTTTRLVFVFDFTARERRYHLQLNKGDATCVTISRDSRQMLLTMGREVRLLDIESGETLRRYAIPAAVGHEFIIRSRFGGVGEHFVTSGSDDSKIYIWDKGNGTLVRTMQAHQGGCVNTVAWSPTDPSLMASVGDDRKLRM
ncbi:hypothetical protein KEM52_003029 [Ascosphaera acerosa]|nr:hypothetical protein KEM52_003029 [Ascosphaera acerosa]